MRDIEGQSPGEGAQAGIRVNMTVYLSKSQTLYLLNYQACKKGAVLHLPWTALGHHPKISGTYMFILLFLSHPWVKRRETLI